MGLTISTLSPSLRRVSAYWVLGVISRLSATAVYSRLTLSCARRASTLSPSDSSMGSPFTSTRIKNRTSSGAVEKPGFVLSVAFPSLELPSAGSRGPGPHPVLRKPPPAMTAGLYPSVKLSSEGNRVGDGQLADEVATDIRGRLPVHGRALRQERQPRPSGRARRRARHETIGHVAAECRLDESPRIAGAGPDEGDLGHGSQLEVEGGEIAAEARRVAAHEIGHGAEGRQGPLLVAILAEEDGEPQEPLDGHRCPAGDGIVEEVSRAHHERFLVGARVEEGRVLLVPEEPEGLVTETAGLVEPAPVERGLVEGEEPHADHGVVLEVALDLGLPVLPGA